MTLKKRWSCKPLKGRTSVRFIRNFYLRDNWVKAKCETHVWKIRRKCNFPVAVAMKKLFNTKQLICKLQWIKRISPTEKRYDIFQRIWKYRWRHGWWQVCFVQMQNWNGNIFGSSFFEKIFKALRNHVSFCQCIFVYYVNILNNKACVRSRKKVSPLHKHWFRAHSQVDGSECYREVLETKLMNTWQKLLIPDLPIPDGVRTF